MFVLRDIWHHRSISTEYFSPFLSSHYSEEMQHHTQFNFLKFKFPANINDCFYFLVGLHSREILCLYDSLMYFEITFVSFSLFSQSILR